MSFTLHFYKKPDSLITKEDIANYLSNELAIPNKRHPEQWWYENADTEVYFCFEFDEWDTEEVEGFESVRFLFNINFSRPDFFGKEAFLVVARFMKDLDLYTQLESDPPHQPGYETLYKHWSDYNLAASIFSIGNERVYYPLERSNMVWEYNFHRKGLQQQLGDSYYAPRIFFLKTKENEAVTTVASWTDHIPTVIPPADYYALYKGVKEKGLISYQTLMNTFGDYFEPFDFVGCKIIHPENAKKVEGIFNTVRHEYTFKDFTRIEVKKLHNNDFMLV